MVAFIVSFLFATAQVFLLKKLMYCITSGNKKGSFRFFALKFLLYGVGLGLFVFKYLKYAMLCACGFAAGMPLTAILIFLYDTVIKKK